MAPTAHPLTHTHMSRIWNLLDKCPQNLSLRFSKEKRKFRKQKHCCKVLNRRTGPSQTGLMIEQWWHPHHKEPEVKPSTALMGSFTCELYDSNERPGVPHQSRANGRGPPGCCMQDDQGQSQGLKWVRVFMLHGSSGVGRAS